MWDLDDKVLVQREMPAFLSRLARRLALPPSDQDALVAAAFTPRHAVKGDFLVQEGRKTTGLVLLCHGMAAAIRTFANGTEQIVAVFVAGDMLNAGELLYRQSRTSISALTSSVYLPIPLEQLEPLIAERATIVRALWLETSAQAALQQEWMVWLGRRDAQARLAHFLCELSYRLQDSSGEAGDAFDLPLTQHELADILGISTVHVNRVLQNLRSRQLIELSRNRLKLLDKAELYRVAEFDEEYLTSFKPKELGAN
jgi:CRP-like cAMP-binding protein